MEKLNERERFILDNILDDEVDRILDREGYYSTMSDEELETRLNEFESMRNKVEQVR